MILAWTTAAPYWVWVDWEGFRFLPAHSDMDTSVQLKRQAEAHCPLPTPPELVRQCGTVDISGACQLRGSRR